MPETVLITGANRGIGLALVARFLGAGWRVEAAVRGPGRADRLRSLGDSRLVLHALDVADGAAVDAFCRGRTGEPLDVLINNAGVMPERQGRDDMDDETWQYAFRVNTIAPFRLATGLLPALHRSARPRVLTLSSQMGALGRAGTGSYAYRSSKAAVNKTMQTLAHELRADGVVVCVAHPGWVRTDMGGPGADLSPEESATGLFELVDGLTMEHSGRFWNWDGREHPW